MLRSALFGGDQLLQIIADDVGRQRISQTQNPDSPSVIKVQKALLLFDADCLPVSGADGVFGSESAAAVHRFKLVKLGVPEEEIIDDVGPSTVVRLDEIVLESELSSVTLFNQFGEPLPDVEMTIDDGGVVRTAVTNARGFASLTITTPGNLTLAPATLAVSIGDLLDRPALAGDPGDSGSAAIIRPQTGGMVSLSPGDQLSIVIAARVDFKVELRMPVEGTLRVEGTGLKVFQEGELIRVAVQANDGSTATAFLDPPPSEGILVAPLALPGWEPPNGYIVQPGDTADSLSERFLGAPGLFAQLSDHDPVAGEVLTLPDDAVPGWIGIAAEAFPPLPAPK
ncbi:conserved hypothetical protein, partial [Ricinus communis]